MMHQYLASDDDVEVIDISHVSSTSISIFTFTFRQRLQEEEERQFQTNATIQEAVNLWCADRPAALVRFGPIADWDTSRVTSMRELFKEKEEFNDDISRWNVGAVMDMEGMFDSASACPISNVNKPQRMR